LALTPQSKPLINEQTVARMKRGAIRNNNSRGKLIDTAAVIAGLKSRYLGGVVVDVYEKEEGICFEDHSGRPLQDNEFSRLLTFPNELITSHKAFLRREALAEIAGTTLNNLVACKSNEAWKEGATLLAPPHPFPDCLSFVSG